MPVIDIILKPVMGGQRELKIDNDLSTRELYGAVFKLIVSDRSDRSVMNPNNLRLATMQKQMPHHNEYNMFSGVGDYPALKEGEPRKPIEIDPPTPGRVAPGRTDQTISIYLVGGESVYFYFAMEGGGNRPSSRTDRFRSRRNKRRKSKRRKTKRRKTKRRKSRTHRKSK